MDRDDKHSAHTDSRYASLDDSVIPDAKNLKETLERTLPFLVNKKYPVDIFIPSLKTPKRGLSSGYFYPEPENAKARQF